MATLNYLNYDDATEFLVYAHGTPDIKVALNQIRDVSWSATGTDHLVRVAYGEDGSWPFTWYMVHFPNNYFYSTSPDAEQLLECPVVIAGSAQYSVVEEILGEDYIRLDYKYLWWPIQDYYDLSWSRVWSAVADPEMRSALWDIIWQRDYRAYAQLKNATTPFTLQTWPYRKEFRLYVRREIAQTIWPDTRPAGAARYVRASPTEVPDPYAAGAAALAPVWRVQLPGAVIRGFAEAEDGTFYVADTANHRIWHVNSLGVLDSFGGWGSEPGQFLEPWDVAIDDAGYIYVADTWNHRTQKFSAAGEYITSWGGLAQVTHNGGLEHPGLFYGPRALAIGPAGELYVADTGNKRVQVFDLDGNYLREFGGRGAGAGQLDEPVGLAIGEQGLVSVVDTWNQRVQVFDAMGLPVQQWWVPTWDIMNPDVKPFLAWDESGVYVTDPMNRRVLAFDSAGTFLWALVGGAGAELSFPQALLVRDNVLYVSDAHLGELVGFELP
jgi:sugar lactone lactonase YvrE